VHLGENEADEEREEEEPLALLLLYLVHHARHVFPKVHHHIPGTPLGADTGTLLTVQSRQPHPLVAPDEPPRAHPRHETRDLFHTEAGLAEHQARLGGLGGHGLVESLLVFKRVLQVSNRDSVRVEIAGRAAKRSRVAGVIGKGDVGGGSTSSSDDRSGDEHSKEKMKEGKVQTDEGWIATHGSRRMRTRRQGLTLRFQWKTMPAGKMRTSAENRDERRKRWSRSKGMRLLQLLLLRWRGCNRVV